MGGGGNFYMGDADIEDEVGVCLGEGEVRGYHAVVLRPSTSPRRVEGDCYGSCGVFL